jgi:hypothetical protein
VDAVNRTTREALRVGLGLKPAHFTQALAADAPGLWYEVHAENYMVEGGPRLGWLAAIRARHPLSLHGVGLSLAADEDPDPMHLDRLGALVRRFEPALVSEHVAWSVWRGVYRPDLLPVPRTRAALDRVARNVSRTQEALGRTILVENPSHYVQLAGHEYEEIEFLDALARRTGCGLLLDLNNVHVSANNLGFCANAYVDAFPADLIGEIHLAGCSADPVHGPRLLIDSHDAPIGPDVWDLYSRTIARVGARPTLIERDENVPAFAELMYERGRADAADRARAAA